MPRYPSVFTTLRNVSADTACYAAGPLIVYPYLAALDNHMLPLKLDKAPILGKRAVGKNLEAIIAG